MGELAHMLRASINWAVKPIRYLTAQDRSKVNLHVLTETEPPANCVQMEGINSAISIQRIF